MRCLFWSFLVFKYPNYNLSISGFNISLFAKSLQNDLFIIRESKLTLNLLPKNFILLTSGSSLNFYSKNTKVKQKHCTLHICCDLVPAKKISTKHLLVFNLNKLNK